MAQIPHLVVQKGHTYSVKDAFYSYDYRYLISYDEDTNLLAWDTNTGKIQCVLKGHQSRVLSAIQHPFRPLLFSGAEDSTLIVRNIHNNKIIQKYKGTTYAIHKLALSPNGQYVVFKDGMEGGNTIIWDWERNKTLQQYPKHLVEAIFSLDGQYLLTLMPGQLYIWQWNTKDNNFKIIQTIKDAWKVAIDHDNKYIITATNTGILQLRAFADLSPIQAFTYRQQKIRDVVLHPNKELVFFITVKGYFIALDWNRKQILQELDLKATKINISEEGKVLAIADFEHQIHLFDLEKDCQKYLQIPAHDAFLTQLRFDTIKKQLITAGKDQKIKIWNYQTGNLLKTYKGRASIINNLAYSQSGQLFGAVVDKSVICWNIRKGFQPSVLFQHTSTLSTIIFSPDEKTILGTSEDGLLWVWSDSTQQIIYKEKIHEGAVEALAISSNSEHLATGGWDSHIQVRSLKNYRIQWKIKTAHKGAISSIDFSPDGQYLASCGMDAKIYIWDVISGKKIKELQDTHKVYDIRFSPTGQYLASVTEDNQLKIWDVEQATKKWKTSIGDSLNWQYTVAFSPDEKYIACGGTDATVRIWDIEKQQLVLEEPSHLGWIMATAFSPDGLFLSTASDDGSIQFWNMQTLQQVLTLIPDGDESFILIDTEQNYYCDKKSVEVVAFRVDNQVYIFEQFDLINNRPDLILKHFSIVPQSLIRAYKNAYKKRLEKLNFSEEMLETGFVVPTLTISTSIPSIVQKSILNFQVQAMDENEKLDRINVFVNDVPIYGIKGIDLRFLHTNLQCQDISLELTPGKNKIQISVLNQAGVESLKETVIVNYDTMEIQPNLYLISIGTAQYADNIMNLEYADIDARQVVDLFQSATTPFEQVIVQQLLNEEVSLVAVQNAKKVLQKSKITDCVIVYIAGHGVLDMNQNYYLASYKTNFAQPATNSIPYSVLENLLDGIPARQKLLLIDACHSGEIDKEYIQKVKKSNSQKKSVKFRTIGDSTINYTQLGIENSFELMKDLFIDLRRGTGATIIASAGGVQQAQESDEWKNGTFTYALLQGLKNGLADLNQDGSITVSELQTYLQQKVPILTNGLQQPTSRIVNMTNDWRIW